MDRGGGTWHCRSPPLTPQVESTEGGHFCALFVGGKIGISIKWRIYKGKEDWLMGVSKKTSKGAKWRAMCCKKKYAFWNIWNTNLTDKKCERTILLKNSVLFSSYFHKVRNFFVYYWHFPPNLEVVFLPHIGIAVKLSTAWVAQWIVRSPHNQRVVGPMPSTFDVFVPPPLLTGTFDSIVISFPLKFPKF